jgi:hypothetical protein
MSARRRASRLETLSNLEVAHMSTVSMGGRPELREQALANLKRKRKFAEDLLGFVAVNGVLWLIWALTDRSIDGGLPWPAWVTAVWGFLLAVDAWRAYGRWPGSLHRPITDEDVEHELERVRRA